MTSADARDGQIVRLDRRGVIRVAAASALGLAATTACEPSIASAAIAAQAAKVGYRTCLSYDVDSLDYADPRPASVVRNTLRSIQNGRSSVCTSVTPER